MLLVMDDPRREAGAEEMAGPPTMAVEPLGVDAVEPLDTCGEPLSGRLEYQVVVGAEEAKSVAAPAVALDRSGEKLQELAAVIVVQEDVLRSHATGCDVKVAVREL